MKTIRNAIFKILLAGLAGAVTLAGCVKDRLDDPLSSKRKEVVFSINIPGKSAVATRALNDDEECEVKSIEMLLFDPITKKVVSYPVFTDVIKSDPKNNGHYYEKSFSVRLVEGTYDVMIFANARKAFNKVVIQAGDEQEETLAKLKVSMPKTGWVANQNGGAKDYLIPMWGMKENLAVGEGITISDIYLHRMLSRIDLSVTGANEQTGDFKIKDIKLYNIQQEGRIAPALANWDKDGLINGVLAAGYAAAPSLTGSGIHAAPLSYASVIAANEKSCVREMYIFEAPKAAAHADLNAPFLTVKGEYNGIEGWYRIDLADYSTMNYLDVLRNHLYKIEIKKVTGTGFSNEEDAKKDRGDNIVVNVTTWNEYNLGGTVFNGQHFLSIMPQDRDYSKESLTNESVQLKTDIDSEITQDNIKLSDSDSDVNAGFTGGWIKNLSLSSKKVVTGNNVYTLTYDVEQNDIAPREGYIYVTLGRLTNVIRIVQSDKYSNMLVALNAKGKTIEMLEFSAAVGVQPAPQVYKVRWSPKSESLYIGTAPVMKPTSGSYPAIQWASYNASTGADNYNGTDVYTTPISNNSGEVEFTIQPKAINSADIGSDPFYERQVTVNFRTNGTDGTMRTSVLMQQYVYNMKLTVKDFHLANGSSYTFNVKSNRPWRAFLIDDGDGMVTKPAVNNEKPFASGGYNLPDGTNVSFTTFNDLAKPTKFTGTAKVRIEWLSGTDVDNPDHWSKDNVGKLFCASGIIQKVSNCYILNDDIPIMIPVKRANGYVKDNQLEPGWGLGKQIKDAFTAELVWSDVKGNNGKGLDADGSTPLRMALVIGSGENGYILVQRGTVKGNSVVAAKVGGKIVWSWHLWVVDYKPTGQWMDRNLGATSTEPGKQSSFGVLYQWGRKDPSPNLPTIPNGSIAANTVMAYNANGSFLLSNMANSSVSNPLLYSIENPILLLKNWSQTKGANWSQDRKTIYDPSPEGYKVPLLGNWPSDAINSNGAWNFGYTWAGYGGYFPVAGQRDAYDDRYSGVGTTGYYWTTTPAGDNRARYLVLSKGSVNISDYSDNSSALSIRCIKE